MNDDFVKGFGRAFSSPIVLALVLLVLALAVRLYGIGDAPLRTDEVYHLIAGESWAKYGTLAMADGVYTRARYYSMATGWFFELFGTSPGVGRALAAIGGTLLVVSLGLWVRSVGDALSGWVAGFLLCFSYTSITLSQFARFYTWHAFALFVVAVAVYAITTRLGTMNWRRTLLWLIAALVALPCALHLQDITVLMIVALGAWVGLYLLSTGRLNGILRSPLLLAVLVLGAGLVLAAVYHFEHRKLAETWHRFRGAAAWSAENQNDVMFYVTVLDHQLGWMFSLFPVAAIIALRRYRQPVLFCLAILLVCLGLHTLAGMKALRYVFYLFPFLFAVWGLAASAAAEFSFRHVLALIPRRAGKAREALAIGGICIAAALAFIVLTDFRLTATAFARVLKTGSPVQTFEYGAAREEVDWRPHLARLRALQRNGLFIGTDSVRTIYYLGGYDLLLSKTELSDVDSEEFSVDQRTGKRDISTARSVEQVIGCYPAGSIIVSEPRWRSAGVTDEAADAIEKLTTPVPLPADLHMRAFTWKHAPAAPSAECDRIYGMLRKP